MAGQAVAEDCFLKIRTTGADTVSASPKTPGHKPTRHRPHAAPAARKAGPPHAAPAPVTKIRHVRRPISHKATLVVAHPHPAKLLPAVAPAAKPKTAPRKHRKYLESSRAMASVPVYELRPTSCDVHPGIQSAIPGAVPATSQKLLDALAGPAPDATTDTPPVTPTPQVPDVVGVYPTNSPNFPFPTIGGFPGGGVPGGGQPPITPPVVTPPVTPPDLPPVIPPVTPPVQPPVGPPGPPTPPVGPPGPPVTPPPGPPGPPGPPTPPVLPPVCPGDATCPVLPPVCPGDAGCTVLPPVCPGDATCPVLPPECPGGPGCTVGPTPTGVPEPSTWAMLSLGFLGLGGALRSRRAAARRELTARRR